jgi:hypothetical protein
MENSREQRDLLDAFELREVAVEGVDDLLIELIRRRATSSSARGRGPDPRPALAPVSSGR